MHKPQTPDFDTRISAQRGVALLTILIMVALASVLAVSILKRQQDTLDETAMMLRQDQALLYAQSAEYFFSALLTQDGKDNQIDHLNEGWAKPFPLLPVEDGVVSGQLTDENSKFNLNTLLTADGQKNPAAVSFFQNMLQKQNLDPNLVDAVIDWQDKDNETVGAMGAENSFYQGLEQGYLAPNAMFTSVQQLQMVRGFAGDAYMRLKPYITALPTHDSKININTTSGFLLSCLSPKLDAVAAQQQLQKMRQNMQNFTSFNDLWQSSPFSSVEAGERNKFANLFGVQSSYFTANITVTLSERQRTLRSSLYRRGSAVQSYQRSWVLTEPQTLPTLPNGQ